MIADLHPSPVPSPAPAHAPSSSVHVELIPRRQRRAIHGITEAGPALLALEAGQQYRFTFDMGACVGCHSCEVACAEQNGLPPEVAWRRVGEIEGGTHPETKRFNLSMACNHCLEPACLQGCPTEAYVKLDSGIVAHLADECIGCQYCTWNCPYSVPQFQPDRRIVTKCDMCKPRLEQGFTSACVEACPTHAIGIEVVDIAEWRADHSSAEAPHLPPASITVSTTRIILPADMPSETFAGSDWSLRPEHAHWPLIWVTLLTQLATGLVAGGLLVSLSGTTTASSRLAAFAAAAIALPTALLHLGRPLLAFKALRGLKRSWLSREVLAFALLAAATGLAAVVPEPAVLASAALVGLVAVYTSGRLYMVPGRPAWDTRLTVAAFWASGAALGGSAHLVLSLFDDEPTGLRWLVSLGGGGVIAGIAVQVANLVRLARRPELEWRGTWVLISGHLRAWSLIRLATGVLAVVLLIARLPWPALGAVVVTETVARWLFFVSVVPRSMPGGFFRGKV